MATRPYMNFNIIELENIYETSKQELDIINDLFNELEFRKTKRAIALRDRISSERFESQITENSAPIDIQENSQSAGFSDIENVLSETDDMINDEEDFSYSFENLNSFISSNAIRTKDNILKPTLIKNPDSILSSWLTLEVLTPQPLPNQQELATINRRLFRLDDISEPWFDNRFKKHGKETSLYWMIYLGEINLSKAMESLLKMFPDDLTEERSETNGTGAIAVIILDANGRLVPDKLFLSSFAWGYGKVLTEKLKDLASFSEAEREITSNIQTMLIKQDDNDEIVPLSLTDIKKTTEWLISKLRLPRTEIETTGIAVRIPQFGYYKETPEPELLNSFFIKDINIIRESFKQGNIGQALSTYLHCESPKSYVDVVENKEILFETLAPERIPLTRWPGRGRYPLYVMQQVAINHIVNELAGSGITAVNGPPGTGKTTLLRDIIAKAMLDRALVLAQFSKPETAFKHTTSIKTGNAYSHVYSLDDRLLGYEMVVASSNNKAVENISKEIPTLGSIADDIQPPLRYFNTVSDAIAADGAEKVEATTWGLVAAILGNSSNRAAFFNSFWWDKERGLATYLRAAEGGLPQVNEEEDADNQYQIPFIIENEKPPRNIIESMEKWDLARKDFLKKYAKAKKIQDDLHDIYKALCNKQSKFEELKRTTHLYDLAEQEQTELYRKLNEAQISYDNAVSSERKAEANKSDYSMIKPSFYTKLINKESFKAWNVHMEALLIKLDNAREELRNAYSNKVCLEKSYAISESKLIKITNDKKKAENELSATLATIEKGKAMLGESLPDETFWVLDDSELQLKSPWLTKDFQQARDDLFVATMKLHRAFIDASAKYIRHNLRCFIEVHRGRTFNDKQEDIIRSLWATFFLVVPVVSTTFASTSRLFSDLNREQIGWLLIDEAGQATPQAAIGALWRSKRAVIIGDPLQIEPVVSIPPKLTRAIFSNYNLPSDYWAAPDVSVQAIADRISWFGTFISMEDGDIRVGCPLRVHRRCEQPMFSISNYIAYNGLMVYGTKEEISPIGECLGKSKWINVFGEANGKWSPEEGRIVLELIKHLLESGVANPDIYIITPFRIVAQKLRELIRRDEFISQRLPIKAWDWVNERVGTIHTFQGKEADAVILVLGAPLDESAGARRWAGSKPNILNVAVTRAKRQIFVIGNYNAWHKEGYIRYLASCLPKVNA